jgi:hypothetical protein
MKVSVLAILPALALLIATMMAPKTGVGAETCPSPAPTCSSSGTPSDLFGTFGCTVVTTDVTGEVTVDLMKLDADGAGNISGSIVSNSNGSGSTFVDFSPISGATYCLNTDDTGYMFGLGPLTACPVALIIDDLLGEVRLIKTTETDAGAITCRAQ